MNMKLASAGFALSALAAATPSVAITVNVTDFSFAGPVATTITGGPTSGETVLAGRFFGIADDPSVALAVAGRNFRMASSLLSGTSFQAYCAELDQGFAFGTDYTYSTIAAGSYFSAQIAADLGRLFTATKGFVTDAATSGAVQAAVWEIIYQTGGSYDLTSGSFMVGLANPSDAVAAAAFSSVNTVLRNLGTYANNFQVDLLYNGASQNFIIVHEVPEPGTWALMFAGLGVVAAVSRRRKAPAAG